MIVVCHIQKVVRENTLLSIFYSQISIFPFNILVLGTWEGLSLTIQTSSVRHICYMLFCM